jgi:predicted site-specific integrase-resolvase
VTIYARVSTSANKKNWETQAERLLAVQGRELVMVTTAQTAEEDLMSILTSFVARLSGRRWGKRKTEQVLAALQQNGSEGSEPKARQG